MKKEKYRKQNTAKMNMLAERRMTSYEYQEFIRRMTEDDAPVAFKFMKVKKDASGNPIYANGKYVREERSALGTNNGKLIVKIGGLQMVKKLVDVIRRNKQTGKTYNFAYFDVERKDVRQFNLSTFVDLVKDAPKIPASGKQLKDFYIQYSDDGSETDCYVEAYDFDDAENRFYEDYGEDGVEILDIREV